MLLRPKTTDNRNRLPQRRWYQLRQCVCVCVIQIRPLVLCVFISVLMHRILTNPALGIIYVVVVNATYQAQKAFYYSLFMYDQILFFAFPMC